MVVMTSDLFQTNTLRFYSTSSLTQQSTARHVTLRLNIILIPSQPFFALTPYCCVLSREGTNTNFIVFGISPPRRFRGNVWTAMLFKLQRHHHTQFYIKYTLTPCFDNPYNIYLHPRWYKNKFCIMFVLFKMSYNINVLHVHVAI